MTLSAEREAQSGFACVGVDCKNLKVIEMADNTITHQRLLELLSYDPETGIFVRKVRRGNATKPGDVVGQTSKRDYCTVMLDGRSYKLHRLAWFYVHAEWPAGVIDHINGEPNDNRIANLRDVTQGQNMQNQRAPRSKTGTGFLGVTRTHRKFQARIQVNGKNIHLGTFDTAEAASRAYQSAKASLHPF